ncbi:phage tail sheath C-terminal domain-containing protein [Pasteurella multocida]|nr:phage tail sheath C-terminal domain-containing protein [Pasteurella multocida]
METIATLSYIRYAIRTRITQKYPRHKLANDGTRVAPGQAM